MSQLKQSICWLPKNDFFQELCYSTGIAFTSNTDTSLKSKIKTASYTIFCCKFTSESKDLDLGILSG